MTLLRSGLWFIAVGCAAALTHAAVFALARRWVAPEWANAIGFIVAFFVSFAGHRWLSFRDTTTAVASSLRRFGVTAIAGFATNEAAFVALLRLASWPAWGALIGAMAVAAVQTFALTRFWAFRR